MGFDDLTKSGGIEMDIKTGKVPFLEIGLVDDKYRDLFDVLVSDVAGAAAGAKTEAAVPALVADRVRHWQAFLKASRDGLSREAQRGLFGELWVLERIALRHGFTYALSGWIGPFGDAQDFDFSGRCLEVKTTAQKKPVSIEITSERQLDTSNAESAHLWVLALDVKVGHGVTLPETVARLRAAAADSGQSAHFEMMLLEAGYLDIHANLYTAGYLLRDSSVHEVQDTFPRITEADCLPGVGDVRYRLQLGAVESFSRDEDAVLELLVSHDA